MKPTLIVSLDFELYWGVQDCIELKDYQLRIKNGLKAIPQALELFKKYGIHATWATVGMIFADNVSMAKRFSPDPSKRPSYVNESLSGYRCFDQGDIVQEPDCFFAPATIDRILQYEGQEVGSHTFSHYYCKEAGQTVEQFRDDMTSAINIAKTKSISLKSIVLPRNQSVKQYNQVLEEFGITSFRDLENTWFNKIGIIWLERLFRLMDVYLPLSNGCYHPKVEDGVVNLMGSRMYKPYFKPLGFLEGLKIHRIKKQMLYAAQNGLVYHLWWHPHNIGVMTDFHLKQLDEIFSYYSELSKEYGMRSLNMKEMAEEVLREK